MEMLLTKKELCEQILGCDPKTAERYIRQPDFPYLKIGKRKKYPKGQVEQWIVEKTIKG